MVSFGVVFLCVFFVCFREARPGACAERRARGSRFQPGRAGPGTAAALGGGGAAGAAGRDGESADNPQAALEEIHVRSLPAGLGRTLALWEALVMPAGAGPGGEAGGGDGGRGSADDGGRVWEGPGRQRGWVLPSAP